jgi:hypothetical protein
MQVEPGELVPELSVERRDGLWRQGNGTGTAVTRLDEQPVIEEVEIDLNPRVP